MDKSTLFGLALRAAGLSAGQWIAREIEPVVSESFVYAVLRGEKKSGRVDQAGDRLIRQQRPRIVKALHPYAAAA